MEDENLPRLLLSLRKNRSSRQGREGPGEAGPAYLPSTVPASLSPPPRPHAHAFRVLPRGLVMTRSLPSLGSPAQRPPRANPPADHPPPLSTLLPSSHFLARRSLVLTRLVFCVLPPPGGRRLRESGPGAAPSAQWMLAECVTRMCARRQEASVCTVIGRLVTVL